MIAFRLMVEFEAERLAQRIAGAARWQRIGSPPRGFDIDESRRETAQAFPLRDGVPRTTPRRRIATAHRAAYSRPFLMHASIAPSAATAVWRDAALAIECASQGIEPLRHVIARVLGIDPEAIEIRHVPGAGCYGHNGADDAALDAALVARALPGHRVLLKWTREDEHGFEPLGPAMHVRMGASLSAEGHIVGWTHDVYGFTHIARPSPRAPGVDLLAARFLEQPFDPTSARPALGPEVGIHRNASPGRNRVARPSRTRTAGCRGSHGRPCIRSLGQRGVRRHGPADTRPPNDAGPTARGGGPVRRRP